jgi:hypothetical protein
MINKFYIEIIKTLSKLSNINQTVRERERDMTVDFEYNPFF